MFPRGTTTVIVWLGFLAAVSALSPLPALRLAPSPQAVIAFFRPQALAPEPVVTTPLVSPARATPEPEADVQVALPEPATPDDPRAARDQARAFALGARQVEIEEPCLDPPGAPPRDCRALALDAFHAALRRSGDGKGMCRVVHFGDSTLSSDLISGTVRQRLQARFGDGGRGFLFVDGPTRWHGQLGRAGRATPGWEIRSLSGPFASDGRYGMAGASFEARRAGEEVTFAPRGSDRLDLAYLAQPGGQPLQVLADGKELATVPTAASQKQAEFASQRLPPQTKAVTVRAQGEARVFGAVLERDSAGVVYDSLGIPGSSAAQLLTMNEDDLDASLRHRAPDLLVVSLGMNESLSLAPEGLPAFEERERRMLALLRRAAPAASCLVTSPMDGGYRENGGAIRSQPILPGLRDAQRRAALDAGCAFWDMFEAMGGAGSMARWVEAGLAQPDLAHPSNEGGPVLGMLLSDALLASHRRFLAHAPAAVTGSLPGSSPGLVDPDALASWAQAVRRAAAGEAGVQARALQFGDSHTAADRMTGELRRKLAATYGGAGRGLLFPGEPWRTAAPEDVVRVTSGRWTPGEGLTGASGTVFGPTGLSATSDDPAASLLVGTCPACPFDEVSHFTVYYLRQPDGGTLLASVDGAPPVLADTAQGPGFAGALDIDVPAGKHELSVRLSGGRPVTVLGVSLDAGRQGITWEALGLSGAYAFTPLGWDPSLLHDALVRRRPQLLAFAYGTNEVKDGVLDPVRYPAVFRALVERVRGSARQASCLVLGPPDLDLPGRASDLQTLVAIERRVAAEEGCAFWDARAAMGGPGSMAVWRAAGLALPDGVHLDAAGYRHLGDLLFADLTAAVSRGGR